jgi:hypothetical protein
MDDKNGDEKLMTPELERNFLRDLADRNTVSDALAAFPETGRIKFRSPEMERLKLALVLNMEADHLDEMLGGDD